MIPLLALDIFASELNTHNILEIELKRLSSSPAVESRIMFCEYPGKQKVKTFSTRFLFLLEKKLLEFTLLIIVRTQYLSDSKGIVFAASSHDGIIPIMIWLLSDFIELSLTCYDKSYK